MSEERALMADVTYVWNVEFRLHEIALAIKRINVELDRIRCHLEAIYKELNE